MRPQSRTLLVLMALGCGFILKMANAEEYPKLAPYPAIRWAPEVQIDGQWYALRSINDLPVAAIVDFARENYGSAWLKRFNEDLVQVLTEMGLPPGGTVKLVLRDLETGQERTLDKMPLTAENREAIRNPMPQVKPEALKHALDEFAVALNDRWAYRHAIGADIDAAVAKLHMEIDAGIALNDFGIELQKIIALGIDGHAEVSGYTLPSGGYLPFLIEPEREQFVAFKPDRTSFLADGFPYVTKIDGKPVADWCEAAGVLVPKGSPQYVRRHCLRLLRDVDYLRGLLKLPKNGTVEIEVAAEDGARKQLTLPIARRPPAYGVWPRDGSRLLDGNVGYLRLPSLDQDAVAEIRTWMPKFRATDGLVVDVRDNGGGIRDPMRLLYSFLTPPADPPRVFTAAAYRLHEAHEKDHLAERFMYRADAGEWTDQERRAIAAFARTFKAQWELPPGQFSDWHYMVLSRLDDETVYHYSQPVVVLMNAKCFSATDIFLAGLKGMNNVTLLGTPSGGGSAFAQNVPLGATPFRVRLGSMASFQADGKLFDGYGVQPDIVVEPAPKYHIRGSDNVLAAAVRRVKREQ